VVVVVVVMVVQGKEVGGEKEKYMEKTEV